VYSFRWDANSSTWKSREASNTAATPTGFGPGVTGSASVKTLTMAMSGDGNVLALGNWGAKNVTVWEYVEASMTWRQRGATLTCNETLRNEARFGYSVAISDDGNRVVVSDPFQGDNGNPTDPYGDVYVFDWDRASGVWKNRTIFGDTYHDFGIGVSLSGDGTLLAVSVGERKFFPPPNSAPERFTRVYQYSAATDAWTRKYGDDLKEPVGGVESLGFLSRNGKVLGVGNPLFDNGSVLKTGRVSTYALEVQMPSPPPSSPSPPPSSLSPTPSPSPLPPSREPPLVTASPESPSEVVSPAAYTAGVTAAVGSDMLRHRVRSAQWAYWMRGQDLWQATGDMISKLVR
jgi:hypothetical protein